MAKRLVKAYAIVHRHGHRTPSSNLFRSQAEADFWTTFLPSEEEVKAVTSRCRVSSNLEPPKDLASAPFGLLTAKGLRYMRGVGAAIAERFPALRRPASITAISTNYNRTQMSCQAVLAGMDLLDQTVEVKASDQCPMSTFDSNPAASREIFKRVQERPPFSRAVDNTAAVRQALSGMVPELALHRSGFDWFGAFDYFTCRRGHDMALSAEMKAQEVATLQHVVDR
jgi:hypothetical protein